MPSSATITTTDFTTFVAGSRAKASQVNTNFSLYRGHIVPINTDTSSASDNSHDLGSDEHRWRVGYLNSIDLETSTSTASLVIRGNTSATNGSIEFLIEGLTAAAISNSMSTYGHASSSTPSGIVVRQSEIDIVVNGQTVGYWATPTGRFNVSVSTASEFLINGSTVGTIDSGGFRRGHLSTVSDTASGALSFSSTAGTWTVVTGSTIGITPTKTSTPIMLSIETLGVTTGLAGLGVNATGAALCTGGLRIVQNATAILTDSTSVIGTSSSYVSLPCRTDYIHNGANTTGIAYFHLEVINLGNCRIGLFDARLRAYTL